MSEVYAVRNIRLCTKDCLCLYVCPTGATDTENSVIDVEKCIGCALCAAACPADAIFVEAAENTDEARYSPGERYASTYEINMLRCIFCGFCEDACPTEAIVLGDNYELTFTDRHDSIYGKAMLLEPVPAGAEPTPRATEPGKYTRSVPQMNDPVD